MKVGLFFSAGLGGGDKNALNLARAFKDKGVDLQLFYGEASLPRATPAHHYAGYVPPSRFSQFEALGLPMHFIKTAEELNNFGLDVLSTHRSGEDLWLIPGLQTAKVNFKIVETNFHGILQTRADYRVFPSQALQQKAGGQGRVIPNAIAKPIPTDKRYWTPELMGHARFVYGRIGRPDSDIYCDLNLRAYAKIKDEPDTGFLYFAPNPKAREDAKRLGIENIEFIDETADDESVSMFYQSISVLCHSTSVGETFGNTIAEAMMHGVPVVSHRGFMDSWPQAHRELFGDLDQACYIEDRSVEKYSQAMFELQEPEVWDFVSERLKKRAEELYAADVVADQYIKLFEEILK